MTRILAHFAIMILLPPLLPALATRTKAWFSGRNGPPLYQPYLDLWRLFRKGAVFSPTTTVVFRLGPALGVGAVFCALLVTPLASGYAPVGFMGDFLIVAYLLGVARFFTILAAMDTGSAFEGMGASREAMVSALAEPALFLCLAVIMRTSGVLSLPRAYWYPLISAWTDFGLPLMLCGASLFFLLLAENCRIPVDDPTTHLELTMIHEVMVLDHSGPDFGLILLGASMKFMLFTALLAGLFAPLITGATGFWQGLAARLFLMVLISVGVGVVESLMARLRMDRVRLFLTAAMVFPAVGLVMTFV